MRAIIKTITYLIIDMLTHTVIVYSAAKIFHYDTTIVEAGVIGIIIEIIETIMYFIHEKIWEKIHLSKGR